MNNNLLLLFLSLPLSTLGLSANFNYQILSRATQPPVATTAQFTVDDATDIASYAWDFGNGETSTEASPTVTYNVQGFLNVSLTVTDASGTNTLTSSQSVPIRGFSSVEILPTPNWAADSIITVQAQAFDSLSQPVPPENITYQVTYNDTTAITTLPQVGPQQYQTPLLPKSTQTARDERVIIQVTATTTDGGATSTAARIRLVPPLIVRVTLQSSPIDGVPIDYLSSETITTPATVDAWANSVITLKAPLSQGVYTFASWSDSDQAEREIRLPAETTTRQYRANYEGPPPPMGTPSPTPNTPTTSVAPVPATPSPTLSSTVPPTPGVSPTQQPTPIPLIPVPTTPLPTPEPTVASPTGGNPGPSQPTPVTTVPSAMPSDMPSTIDVLPSAEPTASSATRRIASMILVPIVVVLFH